MNLIRLKPLAASNSDNAPTAFDNPNSDTSGPSGNQHKAAHNHTGSCAVNSDQTRTATQQATSLHAVSGRSHRITDNAPVHAVTQPAFTQEHVGTFTSSTHRRANCSSAVAKGVVAQTKQPVIYSELIERLAELPTRTKQSRQKLYVDLWSGQHWLCLTLTDQKKSGMLIPVSDDTAVSVSMSPNYEHMYKAEARA